MNKEPFFRYYGSESKKDDNRGLAIYIGLNSSVRDEILKNDFNWLYIEVGEWEGLHFLGELCPQLESLGCYFSEQNIDGIFNLKNLKNLKIDRLSFREKIDLSVFRKLESCSLTWNKKHSTNLFDLPNLKKLKIFKFNDDFKAISKCNSLEELFLSQGVINNLNNIDNLTKLVKLDLYGLSKLTDISGLNQNESIENLILTACNIISDLSPIGSMKSLKYLGIEAKMIPSLSVLKSGKSIEYLHLVGTKIEDGNTDQLLDFSKLEWVTFLDKKYYTKTNIEINEILKNRLGHTSKYDPSVRFALPKPTGSK